MEISVKRMLRTRGALVAGVTALAVGLALVLGRFLMNLTSLLSLVGMNGVYDLTGYSPFTGLGIAVLVGFLPFTVGYFLALWVVAPITEQLQIGHVITRSALATGIGATVLFIVSAVVEIIIAVMGGAPAGLTIPDLIGAQLARALENALTAFIVILPLGVLGGVLQWVWRTSHPAPHHIEGLIDV
jgi:hypothetical protein